MGSMDEFLDRKEKELFDLSIREEEVKKHINLLQQVKDGNFPKNRLIYPPTEIEVQPEQEKRDIKKLIEFIVRRLDKQNLANRNITMLANDEQMIGPKVWTCLECLMEYQESEHMAGIEKGSYLNLKKFDNSEVVLKNKKFWYILEAWGVVRFDENNTDLVKLDNKFLF